ncbi:sugar ABC transporter substrate-binding protein [Pseudokineococcus basanitobsidens]|uniref:Sugar ABC transporter substrate-binding protein n=1 Tax=Pseudokineococcus basanitobsidens TaxID=1926649 RepID=A0ABU8RFX0_9ACTN
MTPSSSPGGGPTRRAVLGGAVGALATAAFAGCGRSGAGGDGRPLEFWQFYAPQSQTQPDLAAQNEWFLSAVSDWNAAHPEQVRPVFIPNFTDPSNTRLATAFASGSGPDVFLISPGDFLRYYNGGALLDLRPYMEAEAVDDFIGEVLATRVVGDGVYALPMEVEPLVMFYSRPAWEAAGLSEGDIPTTWDAMLDVAERLTTPQQSGLVFETTPGYFQNFTWYPWLWQGGGDVVDPRTQQATFDSPAARQALDLFGSAIRRGVAPRTLPAAGDVAGAFAEGYAATWQSGIWQVANFRANQPEFDFGVFTLPTPPDGVPRTVLGGWAWCVNARGRDPDAAARFVVETIGSTSDASVERLVQWCSVAKTDMPPRQSVDRRMRAAGVYDDPVMGFFREQALPTGRGEPRYPPVLYKAVSNAIQRVQAAGASPAEQAAEAQAAVEAFLRTYDGGSLV